MPHRWTATCPVCGTSYEKPSNPERDSADGQSTPSTFCPNCRQNKRAAPGVLNWKAAGPSTKTTRALGSDKPPAAAFDGPATTTTLADIRKRISALTDKEIVAEMQRDTYLNRARQKFSSACGRIDQAQRQRKPASIIEIRRMEFEAVLDIAAAFGVKL